MASSTTRVAALTLALAGSLALTSCTAANEPDRGSAGDDGLGGDLVGAGASSQQAAMEAWQAGFQGEHPGVDFSYDPVGSGGGREQFLAGATDFAGSDAALDAEQLVAARKRCAGGEIFELPNYISPIAVVVNLEDVEELNLDAPTLAGIFSGAITSWDDPAIVADNPTTTLPSSAITPVHRADDSGTTENFTDYLFQAAGDVWTFEPDGVWPLRGGEAANGNSGVVGVVEATNGTIAYADASRAGDLGVVNVQIGDAFVAPTPAAAAAVVENSPAIEGRGEFDFAIELDRRTVRSGEYPIVLVSYHVGCIRYDDETSADNVRAFMAFVLSVDGQQMAADNAGNAPLSGPLRDQGRRAVEAITGPG